MGTDHSSYLTTNGNLPVTTDGWRVDVRLRWHRVSAASRCAGYVWWAPARGARAWAHCRPHTPVTIHAAHRRSTAAIGIERHGDTEQVGHDEVERSVQILLHGLLHRDARVTIVRAGATAFNLIFCSYDQIA